MLPAMLRAACALAALAGAAHADPTPTPATAPATAPGETIVVSGLRLPRPLRDVPAAVSVLDRRELDRAPLVLADDVIRTLPSVGTFRRSSSAVADPSSQGLSLRGVGPSAVSRALVLRDGIPANDPFGGWMYWRAVSPLALERVEVAPAGASALYGNFALGGVVELVSRPIAPAALEAVIAGGSLGTARTAARASHQRGGLGAAVDGELYRSGGYTPVAAHDRGAIDGRAASSHGSAGARVAYTRGATTVHATGRWFRQALDAGTTYTTADVRAASYAGGVRHATTAGTLELAAFGGDQWFAQDRARTAADRSSATRASRQRTVSNDQGAAASWSLTVARGHALLAGADVRRVAGTATDRLSPAMPGDAAVIERVAGGSQRYAGAFVQHVARLGPVELAGALRLDAWQDRDGETRRTTGDGMITRERLADRRATQLDPRLGARVQLSEHLAVRASGYRAFRAPTLNELYRPFQVGSVLTAANPGLRSETLWGAEAGPQIIVGALVVRATGFWNLHRDPVANVTLATPRDDGATRERQNLGAARIAGLELDASWRPHPAWTLAIAHTFVDAVVTEASGLPALVGKRLAQDPRLRTTAAVTYDDPRWATATVQARHLGRMFEDDLQTLPIGAVIVVDAKLSRALPGGLTAFAAVHNAFDRRYLVGRAGVDTEGAPRMFELGLAYRR